ncbi:Mitochondrial GTPase 1 [Coemansia sp. Benny D115]|nr:Mitochondrial GTPase 1 [Coemansia sp. Benny D115]
MSCAAKDVLKQAHARFAHQSIINWFPGHMAKGLKQMQEQMRSVDLILETRDARIPLSSINPQFESLVQSRPRLVIYNKADLAPSDTQQRIAEIMAQRSQRVMFTNTLNSSVKRVLNAAADFARADPLRYPQLSVMVVGMPNVGKSSLINALRRIGVNRGKAVGTGAKPGFTRAVSSRVKVLDDPPVYLVDTPGVMMPHIPDPVTAIKVALTGGIKDDVADEHVLSDYLLFCLNRLCKESYCAALGIDQPTDDISELTRMLGKRIGALRQGGEIDVDKALHHFLRTYRSGQLGRFCLDDLDDEAVELFFANNLKDPAPSKNQSKKAKRAALRQRAIEKARSKNLI